MRTTLFGTIFMLFNFVLLGQNENSSIVLKFQKADSIVLISHSEIRGSTTIILNEKGEADMPELIIAGKLNERVVKERYKLSKIQIDSLLAILTRTSDLSKLSSAECYSPHHSIILYNKNVLSYIDICFKCSGYRTSSDLDNIFGFDEFDEQRYSDLLNVFSSYGFKYEIKSSK